jgi:hypothetical protein
MIKKYHTFNSKENKKNTLPLAFPTLSYGRWNDLLALLDDLLAWML